MISQDIQNALSADNPIDAMTKIVVSWKNSGVTKDVAESRLSDIRRELSANGDESGEDAVLAVLDFVAGWCVPERRIY